MTSVFALSIDAEAASGCEYPVGETHHLIVLIPAGSPEEATNEAMIALAEFNWCRGMVKQVAPFGVTVDSLEDPILREAAEKAFGGARAIVVFSKA